MTYLTFPDNKLQPVFDHIFGDEHPFEIVRTRFDRQILRVPLLNADAGDLFIKLYRHQGIIARLKARLAKIGGLHDWRMCGLLAKSGLAVPNPLGCAGWPQRNMMPKKTLFAQQWIKDGQPLSQAVHRKKENEQLSDQWLNRLLAILGRFVATIHQQGFFPRDLHPGNLLLRETSQGQLDLMMIDYESICRRRSCRKNLAHLSLGHICSYLNAFSPDVHERLSVAYLSQWPVDDPIKLAAKIQRVADEHLAARQKRMDRAFNQIALTRKKT